MFGTLCFEQNNNEHIFMLFFFFNFYRFCVSKACPLRPEILCTRVYLLVRALAILEDKNLAALCLMHRPTFVVVTIDLVGLALLRCHQFDQNLRSLQFVISKVRY